MLVILCHGPIGTSEALVLGLARQGIRYTGVLYAGLMVHEGHAKVLEFNVPIGTSNAVS